MTAAPSTGGLVSLDVDAVSSWIDELGVGARAPLRFARIGRGQSNLTFVVADRDGRRWVLRRPPLGRLLTSAHDVAREHRILTALQDTDVPTPRVLGLRSDPRVSEVPLVLMEHVDGLVVDDVAIAEALSPARRRAIGRALPSAWRPCMRSTSSGLDSPTSPAAVRHQTAEALARAVGALTHARPAGDR
jgi:aminoglycoside phosphotransferase (APT) family kinase protein